MPCSEFLSGPAESGLLAPDEVETLTHIIQIGSDVFIQSPTVSPYKRVQTLGIPASKSLRIHLSYLLKPRKTPSDKKKENGSNSGSDGNWKWVSRLKKMRCCLLCCESGGTTSVRGSRCASPTLPNSCSPVRRRSDQESSRDGDPRRLSISSENPREHKVGFVERAVVVWACLFD